MFLLIIAAFVLISLFAIRRGPVGALGIFVFYMWVSALVPYLVPAPFGFSLQEDAAKLVGESADTAMILIIVFMFFASLLDTKSAPIGQFRNLYFIGPSRDLSVKFSFISMIFIILFLSIVIYAAGSFANIVQLYYQRIIIPNSVINYSNVLLGFGLTFSVFAFRFRTRTSLLVMLTISLGVFGVFLSGGRSVAIIYLLSLFYADLLRMNFGKLVTVCIAGLIAIVLISSVMLTHRKEAQLGRPAQSEQGMLETGMFGLVAVDDVALAVEYVDVHGHSAQDVYIPILALPIPRGLWPDKPVQISRVLREFRHGDLTGGMPPGLVGESYIAGGWLLVGLMGLLFGFGLNVIDRISRLAKDIRYPAAEAVGGVFGASVAFTLFRGGLDTGAIHIFIDLLACVIALRMVRNAKWRAHAARAASSRLAPRRARLP